MRSFRLTSPSTPLERLHPDGGNVVVREESGHQTTEEGPEAGAADRAGVPIDGLDHLGQAARPSKLAEQRQDRLDELASGCVSDHRHLEQIKCPGRRHGANARHGVNGRAGELQELAELALPDRREGLVAGEPRGGRPLPPSGR
jgi:hypothetical protein